MKKRIITLLAILALLITCAVFSVQALDGDAPAVISTFVCPCSTCETARISNPGYKCPAWSDWQSLPASVLDGAASPADAGLTAGVHYYIGTDTTTAKNITPVTENVILIDHCTWNVKNRGISMTTPGRILHLVGNNGATIGVTPASSTQGSLAQLGGVSGTGALEMHFYGDLTVQRKTSSTTASKDGGVLKINKGSVFVHDSANMGLTLTNANDPVFNAVPMSSTSYYGGVFYLQTSNAKVYLEAGTYNSTTDQGSILYMAGGQTIISGDADFVSPTNGKSDIHRTGGNLWMTTAWCDNDDTNFVLSSSTSLNGHGGYYGGNSTSASKLAWLDWGTLAADGITFSNNMLVASGGTKETGMRLYVPSHDNPPLYRYADKTGGSGFTTPRVQVFWSATSYSWYASIQNGVDAFIGAANKNGDEYVKLWATNHSVSIPAGKTVYMDFNSYDLGYTDTSRTITIGSGAKLYAFDSTANATTAGAVIRTRGAQTVTRAPNGKVYVALPTTSTKTVNDVTTEYETTTIYELGVTTTVDSVALRPSANGMYFGATTTYSGLEAAQNFAKENFKTGVAVSVNSIGNTLDGTDWTADNNTTGKGVLIKNIIKDGFTVTDGTINGRTNREIYVEACVTYNNELVFLSDNNKVLSFDGLMSRLNNGYGDLSAEQQTNTYNFYKKWAIDNVAYRTAGLWSGLTSIVEPTPAQ